MSKPGSLQRGLYIVVLIFAFTPLIGSGFGESLQIGIASLFGIYAVNALIQRYSEGPIALWLHPLFAAGAALCFVPLDLPLNVAGAGLVVAGIVITARRRASG